MTLLGGGDHELPSVTSMIQDFENLRWLVEDGTFKSGATVRECNPRGEWSIRGGAGFVRTTPSAGK